MFFFPSPSAFVCVALHCDYLAQLRCVATGTGVNSPLLRVVNESTFINLTVAGLVRTAMSCHQARGLMSVSLAGPSWVTFHSLLMLVAVSVTCAWLNWSLCSRLVPHNISYFTCARHSDRTRKKAFQLRCHSTLTGFYRLRQRLVDSRPPKEHTLHCDGFRQRAHTCKLQKYPTCDHCQPGMHPLPRKTRGPSPQASLGRKRVSPRLTFLARK